MSPQSHKPSRPAAIGAALLIAALSLVPSAAGATASIIVRLTSNSSVQAETYLAMSTLHQGVIVVVYSDHRPWHGANRNIGYAYTTNAGASTTDWTLDHYVKGITTSDSTGLGFEGAADPVIAYSRRDDTFKVLSLGLIQDDAAKKTTSVVYESSSTSASAATSGLTWHTPVMITKSSELAPGGASCSGGWLDKPDMTVDNNSASPHYGRVYATWSKRFCNDQDPTTYVAHRDPGSGGWSTPIAVTSSLPANGSWNATIGVGGASGIVYLVVCHPLTLGMHCRDSSPAELMILKSFDGGQTWTTPTAITGQFTAVPNVAPNHSFDINTDPRIVVNTHDGHDVGLVYTVLTSSGATRVLYKHTADGHTWTTAKPMITPVAGRSEYFPDLARSADGNVTWACYLDESYSSIHNLDVTCAKSTDAVTWGPAVRVTASSSGAGTAGFLGDYNNSIAVTSTYRYRTAWGGMQPLSASTNIDVYLAKQ